MLNTLKKIFVSSLLLFSFEASGDADWLSPDGMTNVMPGVDDGTAHIQLGHTFPYMGGVFTDAWMSSNGFLLLYDPTAQYGNPNTWNNGCCSGFNPYGNGNFSFMLAPLWTDLKDPDGSGEAGYYYKTNEGVSSFLWYNVQEYGTSNTNTFQVNMWPGGSFDFLYDEVNITRHSVWVGFTGHTNVQEDVHELYYGANGTTTNNDTLNNNMNMQEFSGQGYAWWGNDSGYDTALDCSDPLSNSACPGYADAYYDQQCSNNPLYDSGCPGYEQAYYNQQCTLDALYDPGCPGYAEAYFNQQCSYDALYDPYCPGYEQAYYEQQCSLDPLYDSGCPGYAEAYYDQQCSLDALYDTGCPGYEQAYYDQQCSLDALYDTQCPGYAEAYYNEQCSLDALYDTGCPGYEEAYFAQQCDLDTLYDSGCPGYAEEVQRLQLEASCTADPLYSTECPGYDIAKAQADAEAQSSTSMSTASSGVDSGIDTGIDTGVDMGDTFGDDGQVDTSTGAADPVETTPDSMGTTPEESFVDEQIDMTVAETEIEILADPLDETLEELELIEEVEEVAEVVEEEILEEPVEEVVEEEIIAEVEEEEVVEETTTEVEEKANTKKEIDVMSVVNSVLQAEAALVSSSVTAATNSSISNSTSSATDPTSSVADAQTAEQTVLEQVAEAVSESNADTTSSGDTVSSTGQDLTATGGLSLFDLSATTTANLQSSGETSTSEIAATFAEDTQAQQETMQSTVGNIAAGGSVAAAFTNPGAPMPVLPTIRPPSQQQQQKMDKAESLAEKMSEQELEEIAAKRMESMSEDGGFDSDQTITLIVMNNQNNMSAYYNTNGLQQSNSQADWYRLKDIYKDKKINDSMGLFYSTAGKSEIMLRRMIQQQYKGEEDGQ